MSEKIKILIIGNGFGGTYTLKNMHKFFHGEKKVELTMIGSKNYFLFTPLLHEVATGSISPGNIIEPIHKILGCCLNNFYLGKAEYINQKEHTVKVGEFFINYDYLVIAPGGETNFFNTPGAEQYSIPLKTIDDAIKIKNKIITQIEHASHTEDRIIRKNKLRFVVVGGGPTGVELVAEIQELIKETFSKYYKKEIMEDVVVTLIQRGEEILPQFGPEIRKKSLKSLRKKGIEVILKTGVKEITPSYVLTDTDVRINTETVLWVGGIKPTEIKFEEPVSKTPDGRLIVNEFLQLKEYPNIFALGDNSAFVKEDGKTFLPALAQVAEKEAKNIAENIYLSIKKKNLKKFIYHHNGSLVSLGQWMAAGEIGKFHFYGRMTWWLWRTIYLSKMISWRKKMRVALDWTINIFSPRDISQI